MSERSRSSESRKAACVSLVNKKAIKVNSEPSQNESEKFGSTPLSPDDTRRGGRIARHFAAVCAGGANLD
jgi:hypothetical protein